MVNRFAGRDIIVVAIFTAAKYLMVVHHGNGLKSDGTVAGVATFAGKNMVDRLWRGIKSPVDAMAGDALGGSAGKLTAHVATFAGDEMVTAGELETSFRVIKGFVLGRRAVLGSGTILGQVAALVGAIVLCNCDAPKAPCQYH